MKKALFGSIIVMGIIVLSASGAGAHHPEVSAVNECITNTSAITVTTTAWESEASHRVNLSILVTARNVATNESQVVATGQFNAGNNYTFSAYFIGSAGATYVIRSTAQLAWGANQEFGSQGEFRETTITQQPPCPVPPVTRCCNPVPPENTITPTTTLPVIPPTTAKLVTTTQLVTTTVPPAGIIEQQTRREPVLARTGTDAYVKLLVATILIILGVCVVRLRRGLNGNR